MQNLEDFLNATSEDRDKDHIYKEVLPLLARENFLTVIKTQAQYEEFHIKLLELAKLPHGIGLGVALMAQVNIAGRVIQLVAEQGNSKAKQMLIEIIEGKTIISLGVSEPDWKGRLSNLKSTLSPTESGKYILNGEKSFFTNGYHSNYYLVVVKLDKTYKVLLLDKNKPGLAITKFTLPFAEEATHCKIRFQNVTVDESEILDFDYSKYAENLRLSEMLSLSAVFVGYALYTLEKIRENEKFISILKEDETKQKKLLRCKTLLELLRSRVLEISSQKDKNPNLELKDFFPYGTEFIVEEFYITLDEMFPKEDLTIYLHDRQLFSYKDMLNESYIRRSARIVSGIIKTQD